MSVQLTEALKSIIFARFPLRFLFLVDHIMNRSTSHVTAAVHALLVTLHAIAKVYEFDLRLNLWHLLHISSNS